MCVCMAGRVTLLHEAVYVMQCWCADRVIVHLLSCGYARHVGVVHRGAFYGRVT